MLPTFARNGNALLNLSSIPFTEGSPLGMLRLP